MPKLNEIFYLDMNKSVRSFAFKIKQNVNVNLHIALIRDNRPFTVNNCNVTMCMKTNNFETEINSVAVVGNDIEFNLDPLSYSGTYKAELTITDFEGTIKSPTFYFSVEKSLCSNTNIVYFDLLDSEGFNLLDSEGFNLQVRA